MTRVRVGMLGCGGMSGHHARLMAANPDVEVVACCDVSEEIVQRYIDANLPEQDPPPAVYTDYDAMLTRAAPDALFVVTPHTMHFDHGMKALEAGCHVFMEKPMVTAVDQAYRLAKQVEECGKLLVIGYNTACSPAFLYLRNAIRDKTLGPLQMATGYLSQNWMELAAGGWRQVPELSGGGQAYDSGAHLLSGLCWAVDSPVAEVFAFVDNCGAPVDINSAINIRFESGVLANMMISGDCAAGGTHSTYIFAGGRIDIDGWGGSWIKVFDGTGELEAPTLGAKLTPAGNFIDAVLGRAEPRTTPAIGIVHSELMDAIYESARTGQPARPVRGLSDAVSSQ